MTEDRNPQSQSMGPTRSTPPDAAAAAAARQRKKRKWDQPAESLISAGIGVPGVLPLGVGNIVGITLPAVTPLSSAVVTNPVPATGASVPQIFQVPAIQQNTAAIVQKLNQPKIQDELIAREIVINDSEPTIRYKLTKRQTQEEIQKCTGAVVITRGKYRPPNGPPDSEKPLYLHISAGAHVEVLLLSVGVASWKGKLPSFGGRIASPWICCFLNADFTFIHPSMSCEGCCLY